MLRIGLRPSRILAGVLTIAHGAAVAVVLLVGIPLWAEIAGTAVLLVHLPIVLRQHALLLAAGAVVSIEVGSDNKISVQTRSGEWGEYEVAGGTYVMPYLAVLNLRQSDGRSVKRISILPDTLHADDFRQLRVWLRWKDDGQNA